MRTRVKICGITRIDDAVSAARLGTDAIGLVFYDKSPRFVDIDRAQKIVDALPAFVSVVALFVDESENRIREVLHNVPIDCIQFHGEEPAEACRIYRKRYIKAIKMRPEIDLTLMAKTYYDADALLLDAWHPDIKGGTGNRFDWDLIPAVSDLPIVLAGGLDKDNARIAIKTIKPYALDISSGVEAEKGVKDAHKIAAFLAVVNEGDRTIT